MSLLPPSNDNEEPLSKPSRRRSTRFSASSSATLVSISSKNSLSAAQSAPDNSAHKFTLKELIRAGPKPSRRSSTSSQHTADSESDTKSIRSAGSLSEKYGTCQKVAIGKGSTSIVRLAHKWDRSEGDKVYAVKEFRQRRPSETQKQYIKKLTSEFCISSTLHHVNIVETVDLVQDEQGRWCEVMEFCAGGDLYAAIKKGGMSPGDVECCFKQILRGVGYLHAQGVAHRDIKPENIYFDDVGHVKVGDFSASTVYRLPWETKMHMSIGLCGSEPYIAPELFVPKPYDARLVDIWACAIVFYCLHFQELPWRVAQLSDGLYAAYAAATSTPPPASESDAPRFPPTISNLSPRACRPVLRRILEPDPRRRSKIEEVLESAWVAGIELCVDGGVKHWHGRAQRASACKSVDIL
ncbi:Pkinase-domain-containing protein [Mycena kentingensis (nom. inval.)]|nr:Pkinase-domain-containing protein [Mycena kentingensis (nom. inval.)]